MPRHRGTFKPEREEPYELSRSKVEKFVRCPACFWLERARGVKFPSMPGFNLNTNTDILLKRDFGVYREKQRPHPFMIQNGLEHLVPFQHEDMERWASAMHFGAEKHFNALHKETNILFGGGLDDVWHNRETGELHIVDYKSTAQGVNGPKNQPKPIDLEGPWKAGYKRQMDMYQWVMRGMGYQVSDIGYFVYVDGQHWGINGMLDENPFTATMKFSATLLTYQGNDAWVEDALWGIKKLLQQNTCPPHSEGCEEEIFLKGVLDAISG